MLRRIWFCRFVERLGISLGGMEMGVWNLCLGIRVVFDLCVRVGYVSAQLGIQGFLFHYCAIVALVVYYGGSIGYMYNIEVTIGRQVNLNLGFRI